MRNTKGFTVLEYVVALTLLSLVIIMVVTMFRSQSQYGRDTGKEIAVDEAVSMALMLIRQDIMHAGLGVADTPRLAVFLQDDAGDGSGYRELFLSYGRFLETSYELPDNVFSDSAYANISGSDISEDAFISDTGRYKYMQPADVGAMLAYDAGTDTVSSHEVTKVTDGTGTFAPYPYMFTVTGSVSGKVAPAIVYKVLNSSQFPSSCAPPTSALIRNFDASGCGRIILGGEPNFRVTSFRVKAQFFVKGTGAVWAPPSGFAAMFPRNLRYLEVTIGYQIKRETLAQKTGTAPGWSRTFSKSIMVAPRTVMLGQY